MTIYGGTSVDYSTSEFAQNQKKAQKELMNFAGEMQTDFEDDWSMYSGALGDPAYNVSDMEKGLRDLAYSKVEGAWGDNTKFMQSAFGRLLTAQAGEGVDAGMREYARQTGDMTSAAAAATRASIRSSGVASLHQAALKAQANERAQVGGLLDFLSRSLMAENQAGLQAYGAKSNLLSEILRNRSRRDQMRLGALQAAGGLAAQGAALETKQIQGFSNAQAGAGLRGAQQRMIEAQAAEQERKTRAAEDLEFTTKSYLPGSWWEEEQDVMWL